MKSMTQLSTLAVLSLAGASMALGQGRPIDWPSFGGDAQRSGWEKSDSRITKANVKDFVLVLKHKLNNGGGAVTPPVVIGTLISYRGFKELGFVAGSSGKVWSVDVDTDRMFWQKQLESSAKPCPGYVPAFPALIPPLNFAAGRPRPATRPVTLPAARPASQRVGGTNFGNVRSVFVLASDGKLHQMNSADGSDQFPALDFIPAGAQPSSLTIQDGVVLTSTSGGCGGAPTGVWALDLNAPEPKPVSFISKAKIDGAGGFALGADGTVFVQSPGVLRSLTAKTLTLKNELKEEGSGGATPVVFTWKNREMVVSPGKNFVQLIDAQTLEALYKAESEAVHAVSSWEDEEGTRWVVASTSNSVTAFKLDEHDGKPMLTKGWTSQAINAPLKTVITSGVVFALATGPAHATLHALDGLTGKELYSTGNQVAAKGSATGLSVINGRVYFTTVDDTLWAFGVFMER